MKQWSSRVYLVLHNFMDLPVNRDRWHYICTALQKPGTGFGAGFQSDRLIPWWHKPHGSWRLLPTPCFLLTPCLCSPDPHLCHAGVLGTSTFQWLHPQGTWWEVTNIAASPFLETLWPLQSCFTSSQPAGQGRQVHAPCPSQGRKGAGSSPREN